eukprot:3897786-Pyramimonas_sp.AAC.1
MDGHRLPWQTRRASEFPVPRAPADHAKTVNMSDSVKMHQVRFSRPVWRCFIKDGWVPFQFCQYA